MFVGDHITTLASSYLSTEIIILQSYIFIYLFICTIFQFNYEKQASYHERSCESANYLYAVSEIREVKMK